MELGRALDLIKPGVTPLENATWADLGCGDGLFTRALAQVLGDNGTIYAVDSRTGVLEKIPSIPQIHLQKIIADFEVDELPFAGLDGILMANSLHFVKDKKTFIKKAKSWLKISGCFLIIEYNTDKPNHWVPYPISFASVLKLFSELEFIVQKISERPSLYNRAGMYGAKMTVNE